MLARATAGVGFAAAAVGVFGLTAETAGTAGAQPSLPVPMDDPVPAPAVTNPGSPVDVANALLAPLNSLLSSFMPSGSSLIPGLSGGGAPLSPMAPGQTPGLPAYPGGAVPGQLPGQYPAQPGYPNTLAPGQVPGQYPAQPGYPNGAALGQVPGQYPAQSGYANGVAPGTAAAPGGAAPAPSRPRSAGQRPPVV
jgi:hypothetical protein